MTMIDTNISRRGVLAGLGGMSFCLALGVDGVSLVPEAQANTLANAQVTPWVRIAPDGTITIYSAGAEMGQGSMTSLALILAEELDADWSKVKIEFAPADADVYGYTFQNQKMMAIVGSRAVQLYYANLRTAGAQVRKVLLANAAEKWGVDVASLKTEPGVVVNPANGQRLSYGEIAAFGKIPATLPAVDPKELKARKDFRLIGKTIPRRDTPLKVNGSAVYAIDVRLPGMVYATALHSPVHTGAPERCRHQEDAGRHRHRAAVQWHRHRRRALRAGHGGAQCAQGQLEQGQRGRLRFPPRARGLRQDSRRSERASHEPGEEG
jgi:isoquinoline 1-oxidoreductase subunit beta